MYNICHNFEVVLTVLAFQFTN